MSLSHLDGSGRARMVAVGEKRVTSRRAVAEGFVRMSPDAQEQVRQATIAKGDVITTAELAGVMAAKRTAELIPLCHQLPLDHVLVSVELIDDGVRVTATATATARTGVEMEALVAVSVACLTVYDMVKAVDRTMEIGRIRLLEKTGGARGDWRHPEHTEEDA